MNVVNQGHNDGLTHLELSLARTDGVTELALDHRIYGLRFPTLTKKPIQRRGCDQIRSSLSVRMKKLAMTSDRIMLLHFVQGNEADAGTVYNTLQRKFASDPYGSPYAEMVTAF